MGELMEKIQANSARIQKGYNEIYDLTQAEKDAAIANIERDKSLLKIYKHIVKDKDYFTVDDVNAFCTQTQLEYDVLIVLGKKNVGKTRQIYELFNDALKRSEKVIFGRMSVNELKETFGEFNLDSANPLKMKKVHGSTILVSREDESIECGRVVDFKFCQKIGGGEFAGYKKIIIDEVISYDPVNRINDAHMRNWAAFVSTVTRNKSGVKVYLFGNLLDSSQLDILDFYGIERTDNLRYIIRNPKNPCKILFINLRELFKGIENQAGSVQHMAPAYAAALHTNAILSPSDKMITEEHWKLFEPWNAFVWYTGESYVLIQVNKAFNERGTPIAVKTSLFKPFDKLEVDILSDDGFMCMQYPNISMCPSLNFLYEEIYYQSLWENIYFFSPMALTVTQQVYNSIREVIESKQLGALKRVHAKQV